MRVVHVSSEVFPFARSGGLGDVASALPITQAACGAKVSVVMPWYGKLTVAPRQVARGWVPGVGEVRAGEHWQDGVQYLFVGLPEFQRPELYYPDDVWRFTRFGQSVLPLLQTLKLHPDILHGHDWQAGTVVAHAYLAGWRSIFTIHNLQYQGRWNLGEARHWTGLPGWMLGHEGLEYWGDINLMKAGLLYAQHVTTVSPTYAQEITTPQYGEGLDGLMTRLSREGRLSGIINGLDQTRWTPTHDPDIQPFSDWQGKQANVQALRAEFGLDDKPILASVSRLADQKGMDLLIEALPELIQDWNVVVLGSGDPLLSSALRGWSQHPSVAFVEGFNDALSHRIYAGADAFAMPSRFEPCGLSQLIAMRYGTLPIVRLTGGLVDTVPETVGWHFTDPTPEALLAACAQARACLETSEWKMRVARAMSLDWSWDGPAKEYLGLYGRVMASAGGLL